MHIENFKVFGDLVESESFSQAARKNGITQSAVSQQLRTMEKHFNIVIIDRSHKVFCLTPEGQTLFDRTREILRLYELLVGELQEMRKIISGTIQISTIYSIGLHELPPYVKAFLQEYPGVNIRVEYRRSNLVYDDILQNNMDLGLVAYPETHKNLEVVPFVNDRLVLIVHPEHRLAQSDELAIEELAEEALISFEKDIPTRRAIDRVFSAAGVKIKPVMEFDNVETVKRAVEIDAGVAIIPGLTAAQEVKQGLLKMVPLKGDEFDRPLAVIYRKGRVLTPAMKTFLQRLTGIEIEDREPALTGRSRRVNRKEEEEVSTASA
jgi:DNA-binding transcriptional LysR family regulator